jgi:pimeloyl-ACP methyl ester carboxylesterase
VAADIDAALAALDPPRKHYQRYYATREANAEMYASARGLSAFLRAYFHCKSHDWPHDRPHILKSWRAEDLAALPRYYVMDLDKDMAAAMADVWRSPEQVEACAWLTDAELEVYVREFGRTGCQGALNWYRNSFDAGAVAELEAFNGRRIEVPACFIAGRSDWGTYQSPGAHEAMPSACASFDGPCFIEQAGHWLQQEQPQRLDAVLGEFLARLLSRTYRNRDPDPKAATGIEMSSINRNRTKVLRSLSSNSTKSPLKSQEKWL